MKTNKFKVLISLLSIASLLLITGASNAATNRMYYLKGDPTAGTKISSIEATSPISFNKRFAKLSAREQAMFKAKYDNLAVSDVPPFPHRGLRSIYRPIVDANKSIDVSGSLRLTATVNANGFVESVKVLDSPDVKLAAVAEKTLLSTKFDPASCNGIACEMTFPLEITFK